MNLPKPPSPSSMPQKRPPRPAGPPPRAAAPAPTPARNVLGHEQPLLPPLGRCAHTPGGVLNLTTVLRRLVAEQTPAPSPPQESEDQPQKVPPVLAWLDSTEASWMDSTLLAAVTARRRRALAACAPGWRRWRLTPLPGSAFALDLGDTTSPQELGTPLHGTYGWPYLPGSALKGLAAHIGSDEEPAAADRIFGTTGRLGTVTILDALPDSADVALTRTMLTPHHPRYTADASAPPADWDQPVPVSYLTVTGSFLLDVLGPDEDTAQAGAWLERGLDLLGLGGKTTSGHGYATLTPVRPDSI